MRICILVEYPVAPDLKQQIVAGEHPRMEIMDLACKLNADLFDYNLAEQSTSLLVRVGCLLGKPLGLVLLAWQRRDEFDLFYVGNENIGILVATLFRFVTRRPRIAIVNHYISNPKKTFLFKHLHVRNHVDALICLNEYQATFLERWLAVPPQKVFRVHYGARVDGGFFLPRPEEAAKRKYILSVGQERRDYATLLEALRGTGIQAKIVSSGLTNSRAHLNIPAGERDSVEILNHVSYAELLNLYAGCSFVVLSMHEADYPAGITALIEAQAMGKTVIATHSRGIHEFIEDSVNGIWTEPGDPVALRKKMLLLWNDPMLAIDMGRRARDSVKSRIDLNRYVEEIGSILTGLQ